MRAPASRISRDQFFVAWAIEHNDDEIVDAALQAAGDGFQVLLDGRVEIDRPFCRRTDDDLFHVAIGRMQQSAALRGSEHGDGAGAAGGA